MKKIKSVSALLLIVLVLIFALTACGEPTAPPAETPTETADPLVVGCATFTGRFSPFFAGTAADRDVVALTTVPLLGTDRDGGVVLNGITGETVAYGDTDYTYHGIADCTVTQNADGTVAYDLTLREDLCFSDGKPLTADDVIFSMYVLADPTYDGTLAFGTLPIRGMREYQSGVSAAIHAQYAATADRIWAAGFGAENFDGFTETQYNAYWGDVLATAGERFVGEIIDTCMADYAADLPLCGNHDVALGMYEWGFGTPNEDGTFTDSEGTVYDMTAAFPTKADFWQLLCRTYGNDFSPEGIDFESAGTSIATFLKEAFIAAEGPKDPAAGGPITTVTGIEKTGDYAVRVTMTAFDAAAIYQLTFPVAPLHYYGNTADYDYASGRFGFKKGDLSAINAKTATPLGAGPYCFGSYQNGIVALTANERYYKGCPKIAALQLASGSTADLVSGVIAGTFDVATPAFTAETVAAVKEANGGALSGAAITTHTVDKLRYGYVGIHADRVKVGDDKGSSASKYLRRALATLFAVYRDTAVETYYGDRAAVIQYPASWAAPKPTDETFTAAFSTDVDGNPIYTNEMSTEERYAAARTACIGYLKAAGYVWDDTAAAFTAAPVGAKMVYDVALATDGGDHPLYAVFTAAQTVLDEIGITLNIVDIGAAQLRDAVAAGNCAVWAAAWSATPESEMYRLYHSQNVIGAGGSDSNCYAIADSELDRLLREAQGSTDRTIRRKAYAACLEIVRDWGVEVPCYQPKSALLFNTKRIDIGTLTPDMTTYWGWTNDIEKLEMKK